MTIKPACTMPASFWQNSDHADDAQPHAATIVGVQDDRCVNLRIFNAHGDPYQRNSVTLRQPGDEKPGGSHCEFPAWFLTLMSHAQQRACQKTTAKPTIAELEAALDDKSVKAAFNPDGSLTTTPLAPSDESLVTTDESVEELPKRFTGRKGR